jgi:hypothetical protein
MPCKVKTTEDKPCDCTRHKQETKPHAPRKPPSAAQLVAKEHFKARVVKAKKLHEQHPDWAMSKCMKMAASEAKEGWDASAPVNFQNGVNMGFVLGAKMFVARDNYKVVNKNDLGAIISATSLNELIEKLPHEGQINHFRPNNKECWFSKSELYKVNFAFIHSEDQNNVYLDITKICNRMQDPKTQGMIKGKYFKAAGEKGFELKPIVEDFDMVMGSILKPALPKTYKKPKKDTILK